MSLIIAEIDQYELAIRIAEVCLGSHRPVGQSGREAFETLQGIDRKAAADFFQCARVALEYIAKKMQEKGLEAAVIPNEHEGPVQ